MRVAAIDLGTNTTRLLVADVDDSVVNHHKLRLTEVARRVVITRLGEGVDAHGELQAKPTARVFRVLDDYAAEVRALDAERVLAVVAGTVITVAAIDLGLAEHDVERIHGHRVPRTVLERVTDELAALSLDERKNIRGLEPARAPVILGGLVVLCEVMDAYGLEEIEASERDILHGIALAAALLP